MNINKVWAFGRDTYIRLYPNPGIGLCIKNRRYALSLHGGFEAFTKDPRVAWRRTYCVGSRVKRPGGV